MSSKQEKEPTSGSIQSEVMQMLRYITELTKSGAKIDTDEIALRLSSTFNADKLKELREQLCKLQNEVNEKMMSQEDKKC